MNIIYIIGGRSHYLKCEDAAIVMCAEFIVQRAVYSAA